MITADTRGLFKTYREAEKRQAKNTRVAKTEAGKRAASPDDVLVDPMIVLGLPAHECRHVTSLHMGKKGMTRLHPSFLSFPNLEELWLNENKLKRVTGLLPAPGTVEIADAARGTTRLKRLYLSGNRISTLDGDILRLRHLEVLLLANNRLSNLELVSQKLGALRFLKQLDLFGNPLVEEQNYRLFLIHQHPNIELLDRKSVTPEERREAVAVFGTSRKGASLTAAAGAAGIGTSSRGGSSVASEAPPGHSSTMRRRTAPVGFGSHVSDFEPPGPVNPISRAAQLVESRVKQLKMRERAEAELEKQRDARIAHARAEKRRLFHSLWASHSKNSKDAMPEPNSDAARSALYDVDDETSPIAQLIELARQREMATTDQRRQDLDAEIAKKKALLFPSRLGDDFGTTLREAKKAQLPQEEAEYTEQVVKNVFTQHELDSCSRAFGSNPVTGNDGPALIKLVQGCEGLDSAKFGAFFVNRLRRAGGAAAMKLSLSQVTATVKEALRLLADYEPFLATRDTQLRTEAQQAIARGSGAAAAATFRRSSFIGDHLARVRREAAGAAEPESTGGAVAALLRSRPAARAAAAQIVDSDDD